MLVDNKAMLNNTHNTYLSRVVNTKKVGDMNGNLRGTLRATYTQRIRNGNVITKAEWAYENYR